MKEKKDKILLWIGIILCVLCMFVIFSFRYDERKVEMMKQEHVLTDIDEYRYHIDRCFCEGNVLQVAGWIYKKNEQSNSYDTSVVVRNITTDELYKLPTMYIERQDVQEDVNSGFYCYAIIKEIASETDKYEVYIYDNNNERNCLVDLGPLSNLIDN